MSIKKEGDSSSINQAYVKLVTMMDKVQQRMNLGYLILLFPSNNLID